MGAATDRFFEKKQPWSKIKDEVLRSYLVPYLAKVSNLRKPIRIADCFAGKGRFDDGEPGSPLIICDAIESQLSRTDNLAEIKAVFIERDYMDTLRENLPVRDWVVTLSGDYEQRMEHFIDEYIADQKNLFLYVDPFGIKSIRFSYFRSIRDKQFKTHELLLNLNAFGFLREGCHWLGLEMRKESEEPLEYEPDVNSPERMDDIAGGCYWRAIVQDYYSNRLTMKEAEELFVHQYCEQMRTIFDFVVNIPVKAKLQHIPKYRIVFGTNHIDGLLLMVESMYKQWEAFRNESRGDDSYLFEMDFPDASKQGACWHLEDEILSLIDGEIELKILLVKLIERVGISFSLRQYKDCLKRLESDSVLVRRDPELSPSGKMYKGWDHSGKKYRVLISRNKQWQPNLL